MKKREKIENVMTKDVQTVNITNSLKEANDLFNKHHIRHIPVVSGDKLIGIISQTDILRISFGNTFGNDQEGSDDAIFEMLSINQVMKHSPETVSPEDTIKSAAEIFTKREFHALPVVKDEKLVGIITTTDIIKYFVDLY
ncbi:CBS domain-containing protein [Ekhidna sp.]|uniref:CBS domain-containing protein n=1 Tax=Ekhidna sp. TaxID=2608089 RepID=UPI003299AFDF